MHYQLLDSVIECELDRGLWRNLDHVGAIAFKKGSHSACTSFVGSGNGADVSASACLLSFACE